MTTEKLNTSFTSLVADAHQRYGGATREEDDDGFCSSVAIVRDAQTPYIVKLPTAADPQDAYTKVLAENAALEYVNQRRDSCPLDIPRPLGVVSHEETGTWPYLAAAYIPGKKLFRGADTYFTSSEKLRIGIKFGEFSLWMSTFDTKTFTPPPPATPSCPRNDWDSWFAVYSQFDNRQYPSLSKAATMMQKSYQTLYPDGIAAASDHLVHGDLHLGNLITNSQRGELTGVIDFGSMRAGDTAQECRILANPHLGAQALRGCNMVFRHHGMPTLDMKQADFWFSGQILSTALQYIKNRNEFAAARMSAIETSLRKQYPHEDWDKVYRHGPVQ